MIKADTSGADVLAEKLKGLPAKLQNKISRVILKEALKETGAREELINNRRRSLLSGGKSSLWGILIL